MTFDFDENELELLRRALDNYAAYERSQLRDDGVARRLLERTAAPRKGQGKLPVVRAPIKLERSGSDA